ncbi:MAG: hypothetical protein AAGC96_10265 [Pseudomonadota bacterium]
MVAPSRIILRPARRNGPTGSRLDWLWLTTDTNFVREEIRLRDIGFQEQVIDAGGVLC